ncbi:hypothetical protein VJJ74_06420 [Parvimonas micra]|nr:hypothetical protein [Parvimonas micra]MEB3060775.1 hypothetical protein [Parvimonas micra]MEB3066652.1 hypothetical protein [Parvimonas micra]
MEKILTFNELKEIAKKIAMDDDRVERLKDFISNNWKLRVCPVM